MNFTRRDSHKKVRIKENWRKPKGISNAIRKQYKSRGKLVKPGYGKPEGEKRLFKGLEQVTVTTKEELKSLDPKKQAASLGKVNKKNKIALIQQAEKQGVTLVNFNAERYKERVAQMLKSKAEKKNLKQKKAKEQEKQIESSEEKDKEEDKQTQNKKQSKEKGKEVKESEEEQKPGSKEKTEKKEQQKETKTKKETESKTSQKDSKKQEQSQSKQKSD